jgi:hypothetical protein
MVDFCIGSTCGSEQPHVDDPSTLLPGVLIGVCITLFVGVVALALIFVIKSPIRSTLASVCTTLFTVLVVLVALASVDLARLNTERIEQLITGVLARLIARHKQ